MSRENVSCIYAVTSRRNSSSVLSPSTSVPLYSARVCYVCTLLNGSVFFSFVPLLFLSLLPSFLPSFSRCNLSNVLNLSGLVSLARDRRASLFSLSLSLSLPPSRACTHLHGTFAITRSYTCVVTESVA